MKCQHILLILISYLPYISIFTLCEINYKTIKMAKLSGKKVKSGVFYNGDSLKLIKSKEFLAKYKGKINLVFTSPPFPLNNEKKYGNKKGGDYIRWMAEYSKALKPLLTKNGSIVIEIGNSWTSKKPTFSSVTIDTLLTFVKEGKYHLCQEFIWHNPAKLPTPAYWVNIKRSRVKDSFTKIWWMSSSINPKASNKRVLVPYSKSMENLLVKQKYNTGIRNSGHDIGEKSFLKRHKGAIPSNVLQYSNTSAKNKYMYYCRENNLKLHPARMPIEIADFFIKFLTTKNDIVLDPFAGSNTTGAAAEKLDRRWIAIEESKDYIKSSLGWFK